MFKAFLTLIISVAAIAGLLYAIKKFAKKARKTENSIELSVISKISLNSKSHIYAVKAGHKTLLIGATDHNINILSEINPDRRSTNISSLGENSEVVTFDKVLKNKVKKLDKIIISQPNVNFGSFLKAMIKKTA
ncbi:MAG: flagellar biosynthetic protein FliO [Candidatus Kapabacteria bacterium]|nr:flagellar biosynthetic protein FliO [Candidatus Kapabacteria bacterium]